jgi:hypothetical protein
LTKSFFNAAIKNDFNAANHLVVSYQKNDKRFKRFFENLVENLVYFRVEKIDSDIASPRIKIATVKAKWRKRYHNEITIEIGLLKEKDGWKVDPSTVDFTMY